MILAGELSRVRSLQWNLQADLGTNNSKDLSSWLESGLATMSAHAQTSPLICKSAASPWSHPWLSFLALLPVQIYS